MSIYDLFPQKIVDGRVVAGVPTGDNVIGSVHFNSAIPLVPDKRDSASWARLKELEEEVSVLTGKIAMLERDNADLQEAVARVLRAIPVDPVHEAKEAMLAVVFDYLDRRVPPGTMAGALDPVHDTKEEWR